MYAGPKCGNGPGQISQLFYLDCSRGHGLGARGYRVKASSNTYRLTPMLSVHLLVILTALSIHTFADSDRGKPTLKDVEQFRNVLRLKRPQSHERFYMYAFECSCFIHKRYLNNSQLTNRSQILPHDHAHDLRIMIDLWLAFGSIQKQVRTD